MQILFSWYGKAAALPIPFSPLIEDFRLHQLGQQRQRFLPAEIACLGGNGPTMRVNGTVTLCLGVQRSVPLRYSRFNTPSWLNRLERVRSNPVGTDTLTGGSSCFGDQNWTNFSSLFYFLNGLLGPNRGDCFLKPNSSPTELETCW